MPEKKPDGILCSFCGSTEHTVVETRPEPGHVRRRHRCKNDGCGELFTSFQFVPVEREDRERFRARFHVETLGGSV